MEEWDDNSWQGRSKENVKFSYQAVSAALLGLIITAVISGLYVLITTL